MKWATHTLKIDLLWNYDYPGGSDEDVSRCGGEAN